MNDDEVDFDQAKPTGAQQVVDFFKKDPAFPGPEDVDALAETPLAYKELCEPMLKELYEATKNRKKYEGIEKSTKAELKRLAGKERGMIQRGAYGAKVEETAGKSEMDWTGALVMIKALVRAQIGDKAVAEIEAIVARNKTTGLPSVRITPYCVGHEAEAEDDT